MQKLFSPDYYYPYTHDATTTATNDNNGVSNSTQVGRCEDLLIAREHATERDPPKGETLANFIPYVWMKEPGTHRLRRRPSIRQGGTFAVSGALDPPIFGGPLFHHSTVVVWSELD